MADETPGRAFSNDDIKSVAAYYDYGGYNEDDAQQEPHPIPAPTSTNGSMTTMMSSLQTTASSTSSLFEDYTPISPERMARKQRSLSRRNGAGHSSLLKSAVMASMEALDSSDNEDEGRTRSGSMCSTGRHQPMGVSFQESDVGACSSSPRKRARRFSRRSTTDAEDDAIERASSMFGSIMSISVEDSEPVRRVSRRTSYDSPHSEEAEQSIVEGSP